MNIRTAVAAAALFAALAAGSAFAQGSMSKMSQADMDKMAACKAMPKDAMMKDAKCVALSKMQSNGMMKKDKMSARDADGRFAIQESHGRGEQIAAALQRRPCHRGGAALNCDSHGGFISMSEAAVPAASARRDEGRTRSPERVYRHRLIVRITHWINLWTLVVMLMSGLQILNAHPMLYWGQAGANYDKPWLMFAQGVPTG